MRTDYIMKCTFRKYSFLNKSVIKRFKKSSFKAKEIIIKFPMSIFIFV